MATLYPTIESTHIGRFLMLMDKDTPPFNRENFDLLYLGAREAIAKYNSERDETLRLQLLFDRLSNSKQILEARVAYSDHQLAESNSRIQSLELAATEADTKFHSTIDDLKSKIRELKVQEAQKTTTLQSFKETNEDLTRRLQDLNHNLESSGQEEKILRGQISEKDTLLCKKTAELDFVEENRTLLQAELVSLKESKTLLEADLVSLKESNRHFQVQLNTVIMDLSYANDKIANMTTLLQVKQELAIANERIAAIEKDNLDLTTVISMRNEHKNRNDISPEGTEMERSSLGPIEDAQQVNPESPAPSISTALIPNSRSEICSRKKSVVRRIFSRPCKTQG
jgi:chromosome segregation ATPase